MTRRLSTGRMWSGTLRFGAQVDVRPVHGQADRENTTGAELHPETVAAYVAKYATKAAADLVGDQTGNAHLLRLKKLVSKVATRAALADLATGDGPYKRLGPMGRHARLPRPLRIKVTAVLDHPRTAAAGPPRPRPIPT